MSRPDDEKYARKVMHPQHGVRYASFSTFGLVIATVVPIASSVLEPLVSFVQRRRNSDMLVRRAQSQRVESAPVTESGYERLAVLFGLEHLRHPRLKRPPVNLEKEEVVLVARGKDGGERLGGYDGGGGSDGLGEAARRISAAVNVGEAGCQVNCGL